MTEIDHKKRKVGSLSNRGLLDVHEILQAPMLLGVAEIKLDLESQTIKIDGLVISCLQVGAEQNNMGLSSRLQISF